VCVRVRVGFLLLSEKAEKTAAKLKFFIFGLLQNHVWNHIRLHFCNVKGRKNRRRRGMTILRTNKRGTKGVWETEVNII